MTNEEFFLNLGKAIKVTRTWRGLTQAELAERTPLLHASRVGLIEARKGTGNLTLKTLLTIARGLGVPLSKLVLLAENGEPEADANEPKEEKSE